MRTSKLMRRLGLILGLTVAVMLLALCLKHLLSQPTIVKARLCLVHYDVPCLTITRKHHLKAFIRHMPLSTDTRAPIPNNNPELCFLQLELSDGSEATYVYDPHINILWNTEGGKRGEGRPTELSQELSEILSQWKQKLWDGTFGQEMLWTDVVELWPLKSNATIMDLETGLSLNIQRRGGNSHADVQPLTTGDTMVLKTIYGGTWSWDRRAVLLTLDQVDYRIAASINGMPHGKGALVNNFPGHFCLHLTGSTTHESLVRNEAHYLMIKKAAGQLGRVLLEADAKQLFSYFLTFVSQQDFTSSGYCMIQEDEYAWDVLHQIGRIKSLSVEILETTNDMMVLDAELSILKHGTWKEYQVQVQPVLHLIAEQGWKLVPDSFLPFLLIEP